MDDWRLKQSLADDPAFLASLEGLEGEAQDGRRLSPASPIPGGSEPASSVPPSRPGSAARPAPAATSTPPPRGDPAPPSTGGPAIGPARPNRRRSVLDLFPPAAAPPQAIVNASPAATLLGPPRRAGVSGNVAPPQAPARPKRAPQPGSAPPTETRAYLTFYSLDEDPFALTPDPRFFYHATSHDDAIQELLTAIRRREGVVLVTGPEGVGKTTLCRTAIEQLDRRTLTSYLAAAPGSFEELAATALVDFGVISRKELDRRNPPEDELLTALREFLVSLAPLQAFGVLFLDDAHRMSHAVLEKLAKLVDTGGDERLLQIVLVGTDRLDRKLRWREMRALAGAHTIRCRIAPLEAGEVPSYVMHRLMKAGPNPRVDFSDGAFARLHELSRGLPLLINRLCDRALDLGADAAASIIDRETVDEAATALEIEPPESSVALAIRALAALTLTFVLVLVGATAAAYIFEDRIASVITRWESIPPVPSRPAIEKAAPIRPLPEPPERED